ncbi:DUF4097 domain-containing protein [Paenibacillus mesophilus]|uniref:DUF4097 family beta strand repeat-containing protein n=1 Tax=Paenibacillus mesophilus TaxID=2582849 RepID=UPI00110E3054|nr:DUF4097 family beta strand repeat-containing protein [Paenibacillus mesophilus]TMV52856.1 DUF4097 domain-containing protein [Paenibacillus mesophilus]
MKKSAMIGIVLIAALVWGVLATWNSGKGFAGGWLSLSTSKIDISESYDADAYQNIAIDVSSSDVNVVRGSSDRIEVRVHGKTSTNYSDEIGLRAEPKGGTLKLGIDKPERKQFGFVIHSVTMTVELPEKRWNEIKVKVGSGNVDVAKINGKSIEAETSSGNVKLSASEAKTIELKTGSGNVQADGFKADTFTFDTKSGTVKLKDGAAKVKGETGSGDIRIEFPELLHDTSLSTGSGNVTIELDREPKSMTVDWRLGSGKASIGWKGLNGMEKSEDGKSGKGTFGNGDTTLKVVTGSGNITMD